RDGNRLICRQRTAANRTSIADLDHALVCAGKTAERASTVHPIVFMLKKLFAVLAVVRLVAGGSGIVLVVRNVRVTGHRNTTDLAEVALEPISRFGIVRSCDVAVAFSGMIGIHLTASALIVIVC